MIDAEKSGSVEVFTVGHSTHPIEVFISLLRQHHVTAVADVRSAPYSRFNPQFNKESIESSLRAVGIRYVFLGRELGARSDDRSCYEKGRVRYDRLAQTALFKAGLDRVEKGAAEHRIALMCAEKDPLDCHRTLLVSQALVACGGSVVHIHADGKLERHGEAMDRLFDVAGVPREDLFRSPDELRAEALAKQEARIAYVDEELVTEALTEGGRA